jgi:hypothetical protein
MITTDQDERLTYKTGNSIGRNLRVGVLMRLTKSTAVTGSSDCRLFGETSGVPMHFLCLLTPEFQAPVLDHRVRNVLLGATPRLE